jgi:hypothetical protein
MFYDIFYNDKGEPQPLFAYDMAICNGVLDCENARDAQGALNEKLMLSSHLRPKLTDGVKELLHFYAQQEGESSC